MIENVTNTDKEIAGRLSELLEYVHHVGRLNEKPVFTIDEYGQLRLWEHQLKGKIGIQHNVTDKDGVAIWLRIERLKRIAPPPIPEEVSEWITVGQDPEMNPQVKDKLIKTLLENETIPLIEKGIVNEEDVHDPLNLTQPDIKLKDVIFRLENITEVKEKIDAYLNEQWFPWSEEEKPRRSTIEIYDSLFSLQQNIEAQGEEQPIELIWGIGVGRWLCEGHKVDYPLLEQSVEIEIDKKDGSLLMRHRNVEPLLAISAYFALENPGVDALLRFSKKHFAELSEDVEFSPYIHESFEPVLRQASTQLSESGIYWPDINPDKENREPPEVNDILRITDSWLIFARPRSTTSFVQDIERFKSKLEDESTHSEIPVPAKRLVTEQSDKKPIDDSGVFSIGNESTLSGSTHKTKPEFYFPKPFNEAQIQIIEQLEQNDGVVVQGPPGTGKTHTIANIICHYLATGRSILVTSKKEPALTVLQKQIPEQLRELTISLLTNERQGLKQLEVAVQLLAGLVSQTNLPDLKQEAKSCDQRVKQIEGDIQRIDAEIREWGLKQLKPIEKTLSGSDVSMTAMELAEQVTNEKSNHDWLPDKLGTSPDFNPQFTDSDIAEIREARRALGKDIAYVEKLIPASQNLPDSAQIVAIHDDLVTSSKLAENAQNQNIAPLAVSVPKSVDRAIELLEPLKVMLVLLKKMDSADWLRNIFNAWLDKPDGSETIQLFEELLLSLDDLVKRRQSFVKTLIEINEPSSFRQIIDQALEKLSDGKKAFGLFSFGHKEVKTILDQVKVQGEVPEEPEQWQSVRNYLAFQDDVRRFIVKWNHIGEELNLPKLHYQYGSLFKELQFLHKDITETEQISKKTWIHIKNELNQLFPHGLDVEQLPFDKDEIVKTLKAIELNTSRIRLGLQRLKLQDLSKKLNQCKGDISEQIKQFIENMIGNSEYSSDYVIRNWQEFVTETDRLNGQTSFLEMVSRIANKIEASGAKNWAELLKTTLSLDSDDVLTPVNWFESWQWKRREQYLHDIDGREQLIKLTKQRNQLDKDLKRTFVELVHLKTNIGLHMKMSERVKGSLMRFVSAIAKIPKTKGAKRAPRYRRDAYKAMQDCYGGVPCWIMPTWRVSESLPSEFGSFHLVIIDEASQSDITALPAILRAKKLLIVGDDKQVSPTAAFLAEEKILQLKHNFLRGQPFAELLLPGASVYELANAVFPSQRIMLTEHFRCVEPIIRFSMQFYNEPLIPLRLPKISERLDPPLIQVYVPDGIRDERKKINNVEADAIVEEIKKITSDQRYAGRSIGVISLIGAQQAHAIQERLLLELGEDVYQSFDIACGDSATFQGKEKDIMFLSMVVGSGQGAVMNKREDEQRFNVALSRARDRMYLYISMRENELTNESDLRLKVLRHFANPMPQQQQINDPIELCESEFERNVYRRLVEHEYNVTPQVKVGPYSIDLVVDGEQDRRLAIELDGDKYHPPERWMDDWKRQRTMERVGWVFWRCWGSSYTLNPDGCFNDLIATLNAMGIQPVGNTKRSNIFTEYRIYEKEDNCQSENGGIGPEIS